MAENGTIPASEQGTQWSEQAARLRAKEASRAALRAASRRIRDLEEGRVVQPAGLEGVVEALLDVAEGCLAFAWEVGPGQPRKDSYMHALSLECTPVFGRPKTSFLQALMTVKPWRGGEGLVDGDLPLRVFWLSQDRSSKSESARRARTLASMRTGSAPLEFISKNAF